MTATPRAERANRRRASSFLLLLSLLLLAAVVHAFGSSAAEARAEAKTLERDLLRKRVEREIETGLRLQTLKRALDDDPQTIEREIRLQGYGRTGDEIFVPTPGDEASR